ncbi:MAG TPA: ClpX C4-type zinc finger protein [Pyrinomonadaceae bacterium]|nr:ClpX C4-type zinc finger protein [Pyrinomonadaceae bacterium]
MFGLTQLRCSFCRKKDSQVEKLVAGPRGYTGARVYICDACVAITVDIMNNPPRANCADGEQISLWRRLSHRVRTFVGVGRSQRAGLPAGA